MRVQKIDGLYRKRRLTALSRVPLLVWLPAVLLLASIIVLFSLKTTLLQGQPIADQPVVRKASWKVAAVGDIACEPESPNFNSGEGLVDACRMKAVGKALERENLDAVILLGDIQYPSGNFEDFERSFVPYFRDITVPLYVAAGNHDYGPNGTLEGYEKAFTQYLPNAVFEEEGKTYYDFKLGQWSAYALDSNCAFVDGCDVGSQQYNWLTSKVSSDTMCSVAFWHHPVYSSGVHGRENGALVMNPVWSALSATNTDIIISGHDHHFERLKPLEKTTSPRQFVVGTGGHSLRKVTAEPTQGSEKIIDDSFGYLYLELYAGRYEWKFKSIDGQILDSGTDSCY